MQIAPNLISPGEAFDVFYFVRNPLDPTNYYIQAKIYDVRTGDLLDTQNLTQSATNSRLFIKTVQAPPDPAGYGRNIVAIASVYTDSGYTTKSDAYEEQEQYYLIKAVPPLLGGGGGIDYQHLREMMEEVVDARIAKIPQPKPVSLPDMPFDALFGAIGALQREINRVPKDLADLSGIASGIADLRASLEARPQFEKTDLSPLAQSISALTALVQQLKSETATGNKAQLSQLEKSINGLASEVLKRFEAGLKDLMSRQQLTIPLNSLIREKSPQEPTPSPIDVSHLM